MIEFNGVMSFGSFREKRYCSLASAQIIKMSPTKSYQGDSVCFLGQRGRESAVRQSTYLHRFITVQ